LFAIGAACLVCSAISWKTNTAMNWLSMIGKYSYSIYLWHMVAGGWITSRLVVNVQSLEVKLAIYFAISIAMGFVAAKFIEFPFLLFRDKRFPSAN
jgi:peptidoglycan/LPS O-acetylase OafA/YrhL